MRTTTLLCVPLALGAACQPRQPTITEADRSAVVDTVRRIVTGVFAAASRRDAAGYVSVYAADPDVHPAVWNGVAAPTLERLRATADSFYGIAALETRATGEVRTIVLAPDAAQGSNPRRDSLIARAKALELNTPYVPPPGTALEHHAAGFAQIMCSAVFITGLDPDFAAENVGYFTAPYAERAKLGKPVIDSVGKAVHVTLPNGVRRTAKFVGDQGCVTLPLGRSSLNFKPIRVASVLPDPSTQAWPMGDVLPTEPLPHELDTAAIRAAVDTAFQPAAGMTAAFVVTWKGRIIGERYGEGITAHTPLESWSMGKSLTAALLGILIKQGIYTLEQPAPIPEWQGRNDPRAKIRIADLMNMSSGLRIRAPQDPDYDPSGPYPDHLYLYTGGVNSFHYAATRPLAWPPGP